MAVDAGDIGAGHQVTALFELVAAGARGWLPERSFGANRVSSDTGAGAGDLAVLKLRYKLPGEWQSRLIEQMIGSSAMRVAGVRGAGDCSGEGGAGRGEVRKSAPPCGPLKSADRLLKSKLEQTTNEAADIALALIELFGAMMSPTHAI